MGLIEAVNGGFAGGRYGFQGAERDPLIPTSPANKGRYNLPADYIRNSVLVLLSSTEAATGTLGQDTSSAELRIAPWCGSFLAGLVTGVSSTAKQPTAPHIQQPVQTPNKPNKS